MTRLICISDTHCNEHKLEMPAALPGDILVHAGDFSWKGKESEIKQFLDWFSAQPYDYKVFIAGNHDLTFEKTPDKVQQWIQPYLSPNLIYLQDSSTVINGLKIYGSPWQPEFFSWAFNLPRGAALKEKWDLIPSDTDVLITHGPPFGYLDKVNRSLSMCLHTGCEELLKAIERIKPKAHIFGHIHEGYGSVFSKDVQMINASSVCERYYHVRKPFVLSL